MLFLYNFESGEFELHSFFDPVSKVSILLPSVTVSTSFHFQVTIILKYLLITPPLTDQVWITSIFIVISVIFTVLAWKNIRQMKQELLERQMIR